MNAVRERTKTCRTCTSAPHGQLAREDEKEVVGIVVGVPDEFAENLDYHDVVPVERRDALRAPVLVEGPELLAQVDRTVVVRHLSLPIGAGRGRQARRPCRASAKETTSGAFPSSATTRSVASVERSTTWRE